MKERIQNILRGINRGVYEKDMELSLSLLAALSGESILLLGPPGVAKSMVARRLKDAFKGASAFEYLMSRFSTPDEIFGPVSISLLKSSDKYERRIQGYLPTADVVFLDEIWKAGPAIQNSLLTVINEKLFRNGDQEISIPLKLLVAASNELPARGEGLEALWDRFLIRIVCTCIQDEQTFFQMLLDDSDNNFLVGEKEWQITPEEYAEWQSVARRLPVPEEVLACISRIRHSLESIVTEEDDVRRKVYVSDRRWKSIIRLLRTTAFMHDRDGVTLADILPVYHCLWNEPGERSEIRLQVIKALYAPLMKELERISAALKSDLRVTQVQAALTLARTRNDHRDDDLYICDHFYYQLENHGTGNTFIFITDFKKLPDYNPKNAGRPAVMYTDPLNPKRTILRAFDDGLTMDSHMEQVSLFRDTLHIYINGVRYPMRRLKRGEIQEAVSVHSKSISNRDYETDLTVLSTKIKNLTAAVNDNLFITATDRQALADYTKTVSHSIALAGYDMRKLLYGDE